MARVLIKKLRSDITDNLEQMVKRANLTEGYLDRVVYRQYQNAQRDRWKNINVGNDFAGEQPWAPLDPAYAKWKLKKYKDNTFGGGQEMLIATGRLFWGVVGPSPDHRKIVENRKLLITTSVPYAKFVDEKRKFADDETGPAFSNLFRSKIYKGLKNYLIKGLK